MLALSQGAMAQAKKKAPARKAAPAKVAPKTAAAPAKAAPRKGLADSVSGQQYGLAGCGLGSIVFADKPGIVQVVSSTLNGLWGTQTFGITSGTSNCVNGNEMAKRTELFIESNQETLKREIAQGQGESIETLSTLLNCQDSSALGAGLQKNFEDIFRAPASTEVYFQIQRSIQSQETLALSCGNKA